PAYRLRHLFGERVGAADAGAAAEAGGRPRLRGIFQPPQLATPRVARFPGIHPRHRSVLSLSRFRAKERPCRLAVGRRERCRGARSRAPAGGMGPAGNGRAMIKSLRLLLIVLICGVALAAGARAETIKVGLLKTVGAGPIFIAQEKGYLAAEGLTVEDVVFDSAEPIAVAVVSGAVDIGATGLTAGFYTLAGQGALKMIASGSFERAGFQGPAVLVSNRAWESGLKAFTDWPGHSVAISQVGGAPHYSLGLLEEKFHIDGKTVRVLPLQSNANRIAAVTGGTADTAILPVTYAMPSIQHGDAKLLGWVGDNTPWQVAAVLTSTKATNERGDMVKRFLRASRRGAADYRDAFIG